MIEWLNNKRQILRGSGPSTGRNQLALASFQVSAFIKLLLAYMHAHTHTHTHTLTCSIPCLRKWTVSAAFRSFCREDWLDSWNEQRELLPRPSATDHSSLVASSIPLPDWDQWPVTRIQCCLQLPDWVISGLFLWRAPSGLLPDPYFSLPAVTSAAKWEPGPQPCLWVSLELPAPQLLPARRTPGIGYMENLMS